MRCPAALALAALALSACGGSSDEDRIRTAISDYAKAVGGDDPERVCELLVRAGGQRPPERCEDRVAGGRLEAGQSLGEVNVRSVRTQGGRARARLESGEVVVLREVDGAWRIVAPG